MSRVEKHSLFDIKDELLLEKKNSYNSQEDGSILLLTTFTLLFWTEVETLTKVTGRFTNGFTVLLNQQTPSC